MRKRTGCGEKWGRRTATVLAIDVAAKRTSRKRDRWQRPAPLVTQFALPSEFVYQAVRRPGAKRTVLALTRDPWDGAATMFTYTATVKHSFEPRPVLFLVVSVGDTARRLNFNPYRVYR